MSTNRHRRRYIRGAAILCAGISLSLILSLTVKRWEQRNLEAEFERLADDRCDIIYEQLHGEIDLLYSVIDLFVASEEVEREEFRVFTERILRARRNILAINWNPLVPAAERPAFEARARAEGFPDYRIVERRGDFGLVPAGQRDFYFPIYFIEPLESNKKTLGFDGASDPARWEAIKRARDTGEPAVSRKVKLLLRGKSEFGCRIFIPNYRKGSPHATLDERRSNMAGFLSLLFIPMETIESAVKDLSPAGLDICLIDENAPPSEQLIGYHSARTRPRPVGAVKSIPDARAGLCFKRDINFGGRRWTIACYPSTEYLPRHRLWQYWFVLGMGLAVTVMLTMYILNLQGRESKVRALVDERTAELRGANEALAAEIGERALAQRMLGEARERLAVTLNSIGDGVIATDTKGLVTLLNRVAQELTGWPEKEARGRPLEEIFRIVNEETRKRCPNPVERVLASSKIEGLGNHTVLISRDGGERILADSAAPIRDRSGSVIGVVLVFRDVTEIRRVEQELQKSESKYRTLYDSSADAIMMASIEKGFLAGNRAALEMFGCRDEEEFISQSPARLSPEYQPDGALSSESVPRMMAIAMERGSHFFEWTHKRMDGREFFATVLLTRMEIEGQNILQATVRDITELKKAQQEITRAAEEWLKTFNAISDLLFILDRDHRFVKVNRAFADAIKRRPEDLIGEKCYEVLHGTKEPWHECPFEITRETGAARTQIVNDPKIGMPLLVTTSPLFDEKGELTGCVHLAKDITEAVERERKLKEALEVKSQFVSMVSHELRTPLTAVKEGIGIVADGIAGKLNAKQREFLDIAKRNVDRLARLINEVLDFQKMEAGKMGFQMKPTDLNRLVREVCATMSPAAKGKGLTMKMRLDASLPGIICSRDSITQVLTNVIDNAIKYTEKGSVTVATGRGENYVELSVQDTGQGIHSEDMPKLFGSFERLSRGKDRKTAGTGLGLAISRQIVEKHRGKIWAESTHGRGTIFHVILPIEERRG